MAVSVTHSFVSAIPDGGDPTIVQPSNWNDDHVVTGLATVATTGAVSDLSGLGTGIATALAINTGSAGAPALFNGALGTPSSGTLTNCTSLPISTGVSGLGTGIATALAVNTGASGAPALINGALGTPSSGTLTNCTGLPAAGVTGTALVASAIGTTVQAYDADLTTWAGITPGANVGTFLATPSSANLRAALTDETGSGAAVFADTPTLIAPILGTPTSGTLTNCSGLPAAGYATMVGDSGAGGTKGAVPAPAAGDATKFLRGDATWVTGTAAPVTYTISNKTGAYTVVAGDLGSVINCTSGTFTVSLTAAATLGSGFNCWVWNTGTGVITIDPNSTETVDGVDPTTKFKLSQGTGVKLVCDGTGWYTGDFRAAGDASIGVLGTQIGRNSSGDMSVAKTGAGAVSLGGSYASGADSFAAANADSTGTYGAQGANSVAMGYRAKAGSASGHTGNLALGYSASAVNDFAVAIGYTATASGINGRNLAIGARATASVSYATAIGANSGGTGSQAVTGSGAMALGGSYASGTDSFAAAIANNTSSYGATGANSVAIGYQAKASSSGAVSFGYQSTASGANALAMGFFCTASGSGSFAKGGQGYGIATASAGYSTAWNDYAVAAQIGKYAYTSGYAFTAGGAQFGHMVVVKATTDATASVLASDTNAAGATNQLILPNNSAYAFDGLVIARRQASGGTESASWKVEGHIRREGTAASTTLVASTVTAISNVPGWTLALSADTTNGGLAVTFTGAAATNIRTVANLRTIEVIYA